MRTRPTCPTYWCPLRLRVTGLGTRCDLGPDRKRCGGFEAPHDGEEQQTGRCHIENTIFYFGEVFGILRVPF